MLVEIDLFPHLITAGVVFLLSYGFCWKESHDHFLAALIATCLAFFSFGGGVFFSAVKSLLEICFLSGADK